jgi:hypothetical protein
VRFYLAILLCAACSSDVVEDSEPVGGSGPLVDHGGPIIADGLDVFIIWYGDWGTGPGAARPVLKDFIASLDGSPYWKTLSQYGVSDTVRIRDEVLDEYSAGKDGVIYKDVVSHHLDDLRDLAQESNAVYLVLPYVDVSFPTMCANHCGSHNHFTTKKGVDVKIAWAVHPGRCPNMCGMPSHGGVTGNYAADWSPTTIAHELAEVATDPDLDAWHDVSGEEIADKCNRRFGKTWKTSRGADVNVVLGDKEYLLQQLWRNDDGTTRHLSFGGECVLSSP